MTLPSSSRRRHVVVTRNGSQSTAEAVSSPAMKRMVAMVKLKVTAPTVQPGTGDLIVTKGKRTVGTGTLEEGATTIRTTRFKKPGRYRLTVSYSGDALTEASSDKVRVRVVRRR